MSLTECVDRRVPSQITAQKRSAEFHQKIALRAAALAAVAWFKECWFEIEGVSPCKKLSMMQIKQAVGVHYRVSVEDMVSQRRQKYIVLPRFVAMYLCKQLTPFSLPVIGRDFGGRDHTTALSAIRRVESMVKADLKFAATVAQLRAHLESLL